MLLSDCKTSQKAEAAGTRNWRPRDRTNGKIELTPRENRNARPLLASSGRSLCEWLDNVSSLSSIHGIGWYKHCENPCMKTTIVLFSFATIVGLPIALIASAADFFTSTTYRSDVEWMEAENITYPKVTVCHPTYFGKKKMQGKLITYV